MALAVSLRALARIVLDMRTERRRQADAQQAFDGGHDGNSVLNLEAVVQTLWPEAFPPIEIRDTS